jgi:hypothetical protein
MRLVPISNQTLINPEHISYITVRTETPESVGPFIHEYPIYRITMNDSQWFDIPFKNEYPTKDSHTFAPLQWILMDLEGKRVR